MLSPFISTTSLKCWSAAIFPDKPRGRVWGWWAGELVGCQGGWAATDSYRSVHSCIIKGEINKITIINLFKISNVSLSNTF